jgi:hypothetical protein
MNRISRLYEAARHVSTRRSVCRCFASYKKPVDKEILIAEKPSVAKWFDLTAQTPENLSSKFIPSDRHLTSGEMMSSRLFPEQNSEESLRS